MHSGHLSNAASLLGPEDSTACIFSIELVKGKSCEYFAPVVYAAILLCPASLAIFHF